MLPAFRLSTIEQREVPTRSKWYWITPRMFTWGSMAITILLVIQSIGGFTIDKPSLFGYHILGMSTFVLIGTQEIILLPTDPIVCIQCTSSSTRSLCSILLHFYSILFALAGMISILMYKHYVPSSSISSSVFYNHLSSSHSWVGLLCIIVWVIQFIISTFFSSSFLMTFSTFMLKTSYVLGVCACVMGIQEVQTITNIIGYHTNHTSTLIPLVNTDSVWWSTEANIGVILLAFTGAVTLWVSSR